MKKETWIYCILILFGIISNNQVLAQSSCSSPINLVPQQIEAVRSSTLSVTWYEFTALVDTIDLELNSINNVVNKIELYSGFCGSLTRIDSDTITTSTDSVLKIHRDDLSVNTVYKVKVTTTASSISYDLLLMTIRGPYLIAYDSNYTPYSYCVNQNGVGNNQYLCGVQGNCNLAACPGQTLYFKLFLNGSCFCNNATTNWYFTGLIPNISNMTYTIANANSCSSSNPFVQVNIPSNASGTYSISAQIVAPCVPCVNQNSNTEPFQLSIVSVTTSSLIPVSPICTNVLSLIESNDTPPSVYNYGDGSTPGNSPIHTYTAAGTYTLTKSGVNGFCTGPAETSTIQVTDLAITASVQYVCSLNVNIIKNLSCQLSSQYGVYYNTWSIEDMSGNTLYSTNSGTNTSINYTFPTAGTYVVLMTTYIPGGPGAGSYNDYQVITILNNQTPPSISISGNPSPVCAGQTVTLTAAGASTYTWNTGSTSNPLIVSPVVNTSYTVTGANSCGVGTATTAITMITPSSVTVNSATICAGQTATLTAAGVNTYTWSNGANTPTIAVSPSVTTSYTVRGTSTCNYTTSAVATVSVNALPSITLTPATNPTICLGSSYTLSAAPNTLSYTWTPCSAGCNSSTLNISPTVSTTYTLSGTNTVTGCSNKATKLVTVAPLPTITVVASPTLVCANTTVTLTASGANTYTWSTGVNTASTSALVSTTQVFTVSGTNSVKCTAVKLHTVAVNPIPSINPVASPGQVCLTSSTLSITGASTYTWYNGATTTSVVVSPTTTTTYSVAGTSIAGCVGQGSVQVTVGPLAPVVAVNSNTNVVCNGSVTLTASGAASYTWNPGSVTTASIAVSPTVLTVYTISSTYGAGCGTYTSITMVNPVVSTLCCSASNTTIGASLTSSVTMAPGTYNTSGTVIDMQGTITFTGNTSFNGYTLRMAKGTKLVVLGDITLTLTNCKLFSCSELWDGIYFPDHLGKVGSISTASTSIEDMYNGIVMDYQNNSVLKSAGVYMGRVLINNSSLNKNYIAVQMKNAPGTQTSGDTYTLSMSSSTISCNASNTSPGATLKPNSSYTYAYHNITNGTQGNSAPYLNFPRTYTGIYLENLGTTSPVVIGDKTNAANTNTFDNLDMGIYATEAHLNVHNNYFKNMAGSLKQQAGVTFPPVYYAAGPDETGVAVVATHTTTDTYTITVGSHTVLPTSTPYPLGNKFENCNRGIKALNCNRVYARANTFTATTTSTLVTTTSGPPLNTVYANPNTYYPYNAQSAIFASGVGYVTDASYNYIRNHSSGIYINYTSNSGNGTAVKCYTNDIAAPSSTGYCLQAIQVDQTGGFTSNDGAVYGNTLSAVYKGIHANSVKDHLRIRENNISIESTAKTLGYSASSQRTGISGNSCEYLGVQGNNITSNAVTTPSTLATAQLLNGVYLINSAYGKTECNNTTALGRCFVFQGTCDNSWKSNTMSNAYTGLDIRLNGRIGQQGALTGSSGNPNLSANTWTTITQETYVLSSAGNNTISPLYLAGGAGTQPTLNYGTAGHLYVTGAFDGIRVTTGVSYTCNAGSAQRMAGNHQSGDNKAMRTGGTEDSLQQYVSLVTSDETAYEVFSDEFVYHNQQLVYKLMDSDSLQAPEGSALDHFYEETKNTSIDQLTRVQKAMAIGDVSTANSVNTTVSPSGAVQLKHKRVNELMLKYLGNKAYSYTDEEKADIYSYANECAVKGSYVAQARNLVNIIAKGIFIYNDDCETEGNASRKKNTSNADSQLSFSILPNPNNGSMKLVYNLGAYEKADFELLDVTGKIIYKKSIHNNVPAIDINEQNLSNGIYFYRILVNENILKTDKVVIIK